MEGGIEHDFDGNTLKNQNANNGQKIIVILGATGVGKSKLSIELANMIRDDMKLNSAVINADSMQVKLVTFT
jgi:2-phosphoglycerate kinase